MRCNGYCCTISCLELSCIRHQDGSDRYPQTHLGSMRNTALYSLEKDEFLPAMTGHAPVARAAGDLVTRRLDELQAI
jgi:hypothetical protein